MLAAIHAADTPENEAPLIERLSSGDMKVTKLRRKSAARYRVTGGKGTMGPVTLLDLEGLLAKVSAAV